MTITVADGEDITCTYTNQTVSVEIIKTGDELSKVGDMVTYNFTINNTGGATLFLQTLTDTVLGDLADDAPASCDQLAGGASCMFSVQYTVQMGDPDPLMNTVTATYNTLANGTGASASDTDDHSVELFQPGVTVDKTGPEISKVGDEVTYEYTITNTSSGDSPNLILDSIMDAGDNNGGAGLGDLSGNAPAACDELAPGAMCTFSVNYTVLQGDDDPLDNTVTVHYHPAGFLNDITASDSHSVNLFEVSVTIDKTGDPLSKIGDSVNYTITVTNTSSNDAPDLICDISDPLLGVDKQDVVLGPGDSDVTNESRTVLETDDDPLVNIASVTCNVDGFPNVLGPFTDDHSVNLFQPAVTVDKDGPASAKIGDEVDYDITITNTGSADSPSLILVSVTDSLLGDITATAAANGCSTLTSPGGSCNFTVSRTVQVGDPDPLVNTVSVLYNPDGFPNEIRDSDDHSIRLGGMITIRKISVGNVQTFTYDVSPDLPTDVSQFQLLTVGTPPCNGAGAGSDLTDLQNFPPDFATADCTAERMFADVDAGQYMIIETQPNGETWNLIHLACTEDGTQNTTTQINLSNSQLGDIPPNGGKVTINLEPGESVTCTFTDRLGGKILIQKQTIPDASIQSFEFDPS
ncbi:MAG: hypothetical protein L0Z49_13800, partial [Actinobacteria bacterium]|nr:hypothetical protein [Actinomycetota bacterium]